MGSRIDKNDVDISRLFYYSDKFEIEANNKKFPVYIRLVGDAELNQARVFALRESAKMRQKFKDKQSDEYLAYMPDFDSMTKDDLIRTILSAKMNDIIKTAANNYKFNLPLEPKSTATLEEQEEYQQKVDNFDSEYDRELTEEIRKLVEIEENRLKSLEEEILKKELETAIINQVCEFQMIDRFRSYCVYLGSYKDSEFKTRLFDSFEMFDNLPRGIKEQFLAHYSQLEISEAELKK
jgi:hypothetical protein